MSESVASGQTPRKRGRPKAAEPSSRVTFWIPARTHDQIIRQAALRDVSVSEFVRVVMTRRIGPPVS